ncbi:MAG: hypothetical protein ACJAXK_002236 [Yoonia sp.]|jgi:hypothetical protein
MNLPLEITKTLHPNEAARLLCHRSCPNSKSCAGLEAHVLVKLQLLETTNRELIFSRLGEDVSKQIPITSVGVSIPNLRK